MGSHPTLAHRLDDAEATPPATQAAQQPTARRDPQPAAMADHLTPQARHQLLHGAEDLAVRGDRVRLEEARENPPTPPQVRHQVLRARAAAAQLTTRQAERAFDRLNPDFGVPADQHHPLGRQDVRDREAALALGTRVSVHDSRQNDRDPHVWQPGQDYRAADAIQAARRQPTRARHGPERTGPER